MRVIGLQIKALCGIVGWNIMKIAKTALSLMYLYLRALQKQVYLCRQ
jgi:hypothetical protein